MDQCFSLHLARTAPLQCFATVSSKARENLGRSSCCAAASSSQLTSVHRRVLKWSSDSGLRDCRRVLVSTAATAQQEPGTMSKLGQSFNGAGVALFFQLLGGNQSLALPHLSVQDIRAVNWSALRASGFKGVVFDKDNTLTKPFAPDVEPLLQPSLQACRLAFDGKIVLYSNSAGLKQYDPQGSEAAALEAALGIHVLRHEDKKPSGGTAELEAHFGCPSSQLVMVGDRYLTDIVFGNRHGMLTIRPAPLTRQGEPTAVGMARSIEEYFVGRWSSKGVQAPPHAALTTGLAGHAPATLASFLVLLEAGDEGRHEK